MSDFKGRRFQCRILLDRPGRRPPTAPDEDVRLLFQIRRQHIFDPFHECADSAR
jgi:hypothetical protein